MGRRRRRRREVLAARAHRAAQPGRGRCADGRLRRADRSARGGHHRLATCGRADLHLLRNSFRYAGRQHWAAIAAALKPVYTAATEPAAKERFAEFVEAWGDRYPAIVRLWEAAWAEFVPFLTFDTEIRRIICTTNAIESVNARIRRAVKARGHFPNE